MAESKYPNLFRNLFFASLILLPINAFYGGQITESLYEGAIYPYLLIAPILGILLFRRYYLSSFVSKGLLIFIYWSVICGVANGWEIMHSASKGVSGLSRFSKQELIIVIGFVLVLFISTVVAKFNITLEQMSKYVIWSIRASVIVGVIEILGKIAGISVCLTISYTIQSLVNNNPFIPGRIHSLSGEPSWYGIYCAFAFPFLVHAVVKDKRHRTLLLLFLVTIYFTLSRTMYAVVLVQSLFFIVPIVKIVTSRKVIGPAFICAALLIWIGYNNWDVVHVSAQTVTGTLSSVQDTSLDNDQSYSTTTRLGMQMTAFNIGVAHPIFGIGQGQFMFNYAKYIPVWAMGTYEIKDDLYGDGFPQTHGIYARIFAELGGIGIILWLGIWIAILFRLIRMFPKANDKLRADIRLLVPLVIGVFVTGFNMDSFRMMVIWLTFGIVAGWYVLHQGDAKKLSRS